MKKQLTFEAGMEQLEVLVSQMEKGDMPLEDSFLAYKRGIELYKALEGMLDAGDARIRELTETGENDITSEGSCE